ncbi:MAG: ABC transporter ATP-binding protein [Candidatus Hodarchaeales archaeon]|jgi:ABC-2 type transport system ATP-binding protein
MEMHAISSQNLNKVYNPGKKNEVQALKNLNLKIKEGEIYGLLGENGAGKTTTVRIFTTMMKATRGSASILGQDVVKESSNVRRLVGCLPQDAGLYEEFTAIENLNFIAELRGIDKETRMKQINELLEMIGLSERKEDRVETYSGGMKRRLMIARAILGNPKVLFLDEPTAGIDVLVSRRVRELIRKFAKQKNMTVLISTHDMISAERLCDRIGVLHKGSLVAEDTPAGIINEYAKETGDLEDAVVRLIGWTGDAEDD